MTPIVAMLTAVTLPLIDPAVRELDVCRMKAVSFRTSTEGWVLTACGTAFKTRDAGRSWESDHALVRHAGTYASLDFMRWFDANEGFAAGYLGARVLRTRDGGASWQAVPTPGDQWVYAVFTRSRTVWMCGSAGEIYRSDDRARTWRKVASPFNSSNRCMSLAFDERRRGEAIGMNGSRWSSDDDGATWRHVKGSPKPGAPDLAGPPWPKVSGAQSDDRAFAGTVHVRLVPGDGQLVRFDEPGRPTRIHPLVSPASGARVPLLGVEKRAGGLAGWTATRLFLSDDDSESWYAVAELPATPVRLTFVGPEAVVLEGAGEVFRSEVSGRVWAKSKQPWLDVADADAVRGGSPPANPLSCVAEARSAELHVSIEIQGCFSGNRDDYRVDVRDGAATSGIAPDRLQSFVAELGRRITRLEEPRGCGSTNHQTVRVDWTCDGVSRSVELETSWCRKGDRGYSRAAGIAELIQASGLQPR